MPLPSITAERLKHSRNCESRSLPFLTGYLAHHCLGHARRQDSSFPEQLSGLNCLGCFPPSLSSGQNYSFLRAQLQSCFFGYDPRLLPRAILWTLLYVSQESWAPSHLFCSLYNFQLFFLFEYHFLNLNLKLSLHLFGDVSEDPDDWHLPQKSLNPSGSSPLALFVGPLWCLCVSFTFLCFGS